MNIRKANTNDIDNNLLNIFIDGFRLHLQNRNDVFDNKSNEKLKDELVDLIQNKGILVAEENGSILGFTEFLTNKLIEVDKHSKTLWIDQLVVDEQERGKKISSLLIKKVEEIAKKEKCSRVELCCWSFNKHANEVYNHLGFKEQRVIFEKKV